ncbi:MAG: hypothetical protein L0Z62_16345 [Gemmataceae bacterium]|nr:hypothetical protein [Gemmataceae bacterium]
MPEIQILDNKKYAKALGMLHRMGGLFWSFDFHRLKIGPAAYQALVAAGLVEPDRTKTSKDGQNKRGQKKKKA